MSKVLDLIPNTYFNWLYDLMCNRRFSKNISFRKVFMYLHSVEFRYSIRKDLNRASDGVHLRYRFAESEVRDVPGEVIFNALEGPCSVLEMMIALAIRCEENIMDDPRFGDRTTQWFWNMMTSLGLGGMDDEHFDKRDAAFIVDRFLRREYEPYGKGGLFTVKNTKLDLRTVEIWYQLMDYLNGIT